MAQLDRKIFKGIVGNTILKNYRGKQVIQQRPNLPKSHMTAASLRSADTFGVASKLGSYVRIALDSVITSRPEGILVSRLAGELMACLYLGKNKPTNEYDFQTADFSALNGFEINTQSLLRRHLFVQPRVNISGSYLQVQLPELNIPEDIKFIKDSSYCKFVVCVGMFDLFNGSYSDHLPQTLHIPWSYQSTKVPATNFNYIVPPGCLVTVGISLQYFEQSFIGDVGLNSKTFNPAAILAAYYSENSNGNIAIGEGTQEMNFKLLRKN